MKEMQMQIQNEVLNFNTAIELYKNYLKTPQLDWNKEMRRPVRTSLFKAMCETHEKIGKNPVDLIVQTLNSGGRLLFWSDLHFYHHNIIRYADRPFEETKEMNDVLIKNYLKNVTDNDVVIFGGDIAFGEVEHVIEIMKNLPGKKVLVLGNHDFDKNKETYRDYQCFDVVTLAFTIQRIIDGKTYNVLVTHYPVNPDVLPPNTINIHGHIHQNKSQKKQINMSVENVGFKPICMEKQIFDMIQTLK